jgi:hypothetical protein
MVCPASFLLLPLLLGQKLCRRGRFGRPHHAGSSGRDDPSFCGYFVTFSLTDSLPPSCLDGYFVVVVFSVPGGCFATVTSSPALADFR